MKVTRIRRGSAVVAVSTVVHQVNKVNTPV